MSTEWITSNNRSASMSLGDNTSRMFADPAVTKGWKDDLGEV